MAKQQAKGTFEVTLTPLEKHHQDALGNQFDRMSIDKTFRGDIEGSSVGEMLSARTSTPGSAGYVAIEQVQANLDGKRGHFVLQHFGTMSSGANQLILEVIPDSAGGELTGLSGKMTIEIKDGAHFYQLEYQFN